MAPPQACRGGPAAPPAESVVGVGDGREEEGQGVCCGQHEVNSSYSSEAGCEVHGSQRAWLVVRPRAARLDKQ